MTTSTNTIVIEFERGKADDLDSARLNFPYEEDEDVLLLAQFLYELQSIGYDEGGMAGFWKLRGTDLFTGEGDSEDRRKAKTAWASHMADAKRAEDERLARFDRGLSVGDSFPSIGGPTLIVTSIGTLYGIVATQDGLGWNDAWHKPEDGPTTGDSVFYERYTREGTRIGHGYVDPTSRKITQTG